MIVQRRRWDAGFELIARFGPRWNDNGSGAAGAIVGGEIDAVAWLEA